MTGAAETRLCPSEPNNGKRERTLTKRDGGVRLDAFPFEPFFI